MHLVTPMTNIILFKMGLYLNMNYYLVPRCQWFISACCVKQLVANPILNKVYDWLWYSVLLPVHKIWNVLIEFPEIELRKEKVMFYCGDLNSECFSYVNC